MMEIGSRATLRDTTGARWLLLCALAGLGVLASAWAHAQQAGPPADSGEDLAKKLANPVAALISVPFQYNHDDKIGSSDGSKDYLNIQPVIPLSMSPDWNLITRTIVPLVDLTRPAAARRQRVRTG